MLKDYIIKYRVNYVLGHKGESYLKWVANSFGFRFGEKKIWFLGNLNSKHTTQTKLPSFPLGPIATWNSTKS